MAENFRPPPLFPSVFVKTDFSTSQLSIIQNTKSMESVGLGSFSINKDRDPKHSKLEKLISFLSMMHDVGQEGFDQEIAVFAELTESVLDSFKDPSLKRIFRSYGWTGRRFQMVEKMFEREKLLQAVSNLYLKYEYQNSTFVNNLLEGGGFNHIEKLAAFAPDVVVECIKSRPNLFIEASLEPPRFPISGACMLIDISGFSKFSASMCLRGAEGLDELRKTTSGMLGKIVKAVYEHEGDVMAFAGDALICVFQDCEDGGDEWLEDNLKAIDGCFRALHCADLLRELKVFDLSTHIGISKGAMTLAFLGGHNSFWTYLINGPCITQLSSCIEDASPHHVVVTKEVYLHLQMLGALEKTTMGKQYPEVLMTSIGCHDNYHFESIQGDKSLNQQLNTAGRGTFISKLLVTSRSPKADESTSERPRIQRAPSGRVILKNTPSAPSKDSSKNRLLRRSSMRNLTLNTTSFLGELKQASVDSDNDLSSLLLEPLTNFVPKPVLVAIHTESSHQIGELRTVTTLFLSLDSYDQIGNADPATLQPFFLIAQQVMQETGGFLRQFLIDDKGCVLIIMWGVPLYTYSNNCSRALYTAFSISQRIRKEVGHHCSIGITTGSVFCGTIGAVERSDYVGIGNEVNLAARFMAKAKGKILVDFATYQNLNEDNRHLLERGDAMVLKGMPEPIHPYIYVADHAPTLALVDAKSTSKNKLLKKKIMQELEKQLDKVGRSLTGKLMASMEHLHYRQGSPITTNPKRMSGVRRGSDACFDSNSNFTIVAGPAGSGKKTAADYFLISARERGLQTIQLIPKSHYRSIPYGVIRDLFVELVGEHKIRDADAQRSFIKALLEETFPDEPENRAIAHSTIQAILGQYGTGSSSSKAPALGLSRDISISIYGSFDAMDIHNTHNQNSFNDDLNKSHENDEDQLLPFGFKKGASHSGKDSGDLSFYRVLTMLLKGTPTAIVIEDAQFCDELSWNELYLMLSGFELDISVLLTIKSKPGPRRINSNNSTTSITSPRFHTAHSPSKLGHSGTNWNATTSNTRNNSLTNSHFCVEDEEGEEEIDPLERAGLSDYATGMFPSIFKHAQCRFLELKSLSEDEVKTLLLHTLKIEAIAPEFLRLVMDVSSGNTYWVKNIANLMKELDPKEIAQKVQATTTAQGALKSLIVCRLDLLDPEARLVAKYASIVGFEFTGKLLDTIVPGRSGNSVSGSTTSSPTQHQLLQRENTMTISGLNSNSSHSRYHSRASDVMGKRPLASILEELEKGGFIYCVTETPETIYAFQNELLQQTLYEMILPSDAANTHVSIASFLEEEYQDNLRPYYPSLAFHFRQGNNRIKAFKYEIKAAALAITSGALADGYTYAESALELVENLPQLQVLTEVIDQAITALEPFNTPGIQRTMSSNYVSFMYHRESSINFSVSKKVVVNPSENHTLSTHLMRTEADEVGDDIEDPEEHDERNFLEEACKPVVESRIASEQATLKLFSRLRNRTEALKVQLEQHKTLVAYEQLPERESLYHGFEALMYSRKQLSWQPSFSSKNHGQSPQESSSSAASSASSMNPTSLTPTTETQAASPATTKASTPRGFQRSTAEHIHVDSSDGKKSAVNSDEMHPKVGCHCIIQ